MRGKVPAYRDPALHFDALHLVALREGGRTEKALAAESERRMHMRRACAHTFSPRSSLLLEHSLPPTPSPLCELA